MLLFFCLYFRCNIFHAIKKSLPKYDEVGGGVGTSCFFKGFSLQHNVYKFVSVLRPSMSRCIHVGHTFAHI